LTRACQYLDETAKAVLVIGAPLICGSSFPVLDHGLHAACSIIERFRDRVVGIAHVRDAACCNVVTVDGEEATRVLDGCVYVTNQLTAVD
jgi:hypothetical protein